MSEVKHCQLLILGSGPAGYTAAIYAARANMKPVLVTGMQQGGQLTTTDEIENWPGDAGNITGSELMMRMQAHAEKFESEIVFDQINKTDLSKRPFTLYGDSKTYTRDALIIATGATPNKLHIPGEDEFLGKGVSYCATCGGWFFKDKAVVVVGGGDSALEEAIFLTRYASSVKIIHRRDELRAGAILQKRALSNPKIEVVWDSVVKEVKGSNGVEEIELENVKTGKRSELLTDGFFVFIGHKPTTALFKSQLELDEKGYIIVDKRMRTNISGVFVAGEACDPLYRQVITSAGMGAMAAIEVTRFLES